MRLTLTTADIWSLKKGVAESSLYAFLKQAWPHFDPSPFTDAWHVAAIADHLEAVNSGEIRRLLVNIPPRFGKTNLVAIAWPLWTWIQEPQRDYPLKGPGVRFLCASYGANKAQADGVTARRIIASKWFQERWGRRVVVEKSRDNQEQYDTTAGGYRISTGIPESLGKGGAIRICFPWSQPVQTADGPVPIGQLVDEKRNAKVWSWNEESGQPELQPIIGWHANPGSTILRLTFDNGLVVNCTPDHVFRVTAGNWQPASEIPVGSRWEVAWPSQALGVPRPEAPLPDGCDREVVHAKLGGEPLGGLSAYTHGLSDFRRKFGSFDNPCKQSAMLAGVLHVVPPRAVGEVVSAVVNRVAIKVAHIKALLLRTYECLGHRLVNEHVEGLAVPPQGYTEVTSFVAGRARHHALPMKAHYSAVLDNSSLQSLHPSVAGDLVAREAGERDPNFATLVSVDHVGYSHRTYCLTICHHHNMMVGDYNCIVAANCDDPHKTTEVESKEVIASQIRAYDEVWRTRSNDPNYGAEVIIMQRLGEDDLSGHLLTKDFDDIVHLVLPLRFESDRSCETAIGFRDYRRRDGELLWPQRFDEAWAKKQEADIGAFAFAGQYQQRPEPRGGGIIKREWWQIYGPDDPIKERLKFPQFTFVLAILDTALTEETRNDPSGLVLLGVWSDPNTGFQQVMLTYAWRRWLQMRDLAIQVAHTCDRYRVDRLIIENRTIGQPIYDELRRQWTDRDWGVELVEAYSRVKGGKEIRANSVTHIFEEGMVHRPNTDWGQMVEDECSVFPRGAHDEMVDCVVHGLRWLRDAGILSRKVEQRQRERAMEAYKGRGDRKALYSV